MYCQNPGQDISDKLKGFYENKAQAVGNEGGPRHSRAWSRVGGVMAEGIDWSLIRV